MSLNLAHRIAELRACENVAELHVVALDDRENRALVLIVPRACAGASVDSGWEQPSRPFMMMIDSTSLIDEHGLH